MRFIISLVFFLVLVSCNPENEKENNSKENTEFVQLEAIENSIFKQVLEAKQKHRLSVKGKELLKLSQVYITSHPKDSLLERVYEMAALGAEIGGQYDDAINYLYLEQRNFPKSKKAPIYLFNRARILDDIPQNTNQSILAYQELIELYPFDSISITMKNYLISDLL